MLQEGIERVDAAYEVFLKEGLEDFKHFAYELQTVAEQNLAPERVKTYIAIIHQHKGLKETNKVMKYILLVLGKYLQMMVAYKIFKEDDVENRVANLYETFNAHFNQLRGAFEEVTGTTFSPKQMEETGLGQRQEHALGWELLFSSDIANLAFITHSLFQRHV